MKIAVTGATGFIGTALSNALAKDGIEILAITRRPGSVPSGLKAVAWNPQSGDFDAASMEGVDGVVHLAGESIAQRWSRTRKQDFYRSRVRGVQVLVNSLKSLDRRPSFLVSASAVGFYGDRGEEELDEGSPAGIGFLPELCQAWEAEVARASDLGMRAVSLRIGVVLSSRGGALARMLLPFKLGLGGPLGRGDQWMSWIHLDDLVAIFGSLINREDLSGVFNATSPEPVRQRDFAKALGTVLGRPAFIPTPGLAVKIAFGEMGRTLLLEGQRVLPRRLQASGFRFQYPKLGEALKDVLTSGK